MKKQIKKLNLNKRTISNLITHEMTKVVGGAPSNYCYTDFHCTRACPATVECVPTQKGRTCNGNNQCV